SSRANESAPAAAISAFGPTRPSPPLGRALHFLQQVTKVDALTTPPSNRVVSGMPASVHFLSADAAAAMPDSRHNLRNAGQVFATNRETRNLCGEIRLKQACGRC